MPRTANDINVSGLVELVRQWNAELDRRLAQAAQWEFEQEVIQAERERQRRWRQDREKHGL